MPSTAAQREGAESLICPNCEEEIDHLRYSQDCTEYGTCSLDGENFDHSDTDSNGNVRYRCPECDDNIGNLNNLHMPVPVEPLPVASTTTPRVNPGDIVVNPGLVVGSLSTEELRQAYDNIQRWRGQRADSSRSPQHENPTVLPGLGEFYAQDENRWENRMRQNKLSRATCSNEKCKTSFHITATEQNPECPKCGTRTNKIKRMA